MAVNLKSFARSLAEKPLPVPEMRLKQCLRVLKTSKRSLAGVSALIALDPGLCMLVLRYVNRIRSQSDNRIEINSVVSAVNLLGENALNNLLASAPILEQKIKEPQAIDDYIDIVDRCIHAAQFAKRWAKIRNDGVPGELEVAGLLRDIGELALCAHHHQSYAEIRRNAEQKRVCSARASTNILGFSTTQLGRALATHWHMPDVVRDGLNTRRWELFRPQGVMLASECARLAERGWYHPDMILCEELIADYLNLGFDRVCLDLHKVTVAIARKGVLHKPSRFASQLIQQPLEQSESLSTPTQGKDDTAFAEEPAKAAESDLKKQREQRARVFALSAKQLKQQATAGKCASSDLIKTTLQGLHAGLNFNRVVFSVLNTRDKVLEAKLARGVELATAGGFEFPCAKNSLFSVVLKSQQCIWVNDKNRSKLQALLPGSFLKSTGASNFLLASVFLLDRPIGIVYADCTNDNVEIDEHMYQGAKSLIAFTGKAMSMLESKKRAAKKAAEQSVDGGGQVLYKKTVPVNQSAKKRA